MYFDFWHSRLGFLLKTRRNTFCIKVFLLSLFLKMTITGWFLGNITITVTATSAFYTLVKAVPSVFGFPGFRF